MVSPAEEIWRFSLHQPVMRATAHRGAVDLKPWACTKAALVRVARVSPIRPDSILVTAGRSSTLVSVPCTFPARCTVQTANAILARALYMYQAAIPEELGFAKGDYLAVLRHQDDGWWEAEVHNGNGRVGLVPSNYLQPC